MHACTFIQLRHIEGPTVQRMTNAAKKRRLLILRDLKSLREQKTFRKLVCSFLQSPNAIDADQIFEREAAAYLEEYPDESTAMLALIKAVDKYRPFSCRCGAAEYVLLDLKAMVKCSNCGLRQKLTASCDYLRGMKMPRLTLGAIHIKAHCSVFCIKAFAKRFGYSYGACYEQFQKLDNIIFQHTLTLKAIENVDTALFNRCWTRRSIATPANEAPIAEQIAATRHIQPELRDEALKPQRVDVLDRSADEQIAYQHICSDAILFDALMTKTGLDVATLSSAITMLELDGLIEALPGSKFILGKATNAGRTQVFSELQRKANRVDKVHRATVDQLVPLLILQNNGFSRKHLQNYIVDRWRVLTIFASGRPLNLLEMCIKYEDVAEVHIARDGCPLQVRIPLIKGNPKKIIVKC
jgi:hypothetical protein